MISGKTRKLRRIFREDGKATIIPMDHAVTLGPIKGLVDMQKIVDNLLKGDVDAILIHPGIAKRVDCGRAGLIIHLSGSTKLGPDILWKVKTCTVSEAVRLGADAVSVHVNFFSNREPDMLKELAKTVEECDELGVPLLVMAYPRGPAVKDEHAPDVVAHAARIAEELGADVVKTNYTGDVESFRDVIQACRIPVVIAGGPKVESAEEFLRMVHGAIQAGAKGVSIGRNVFQHDNPTGMVRALNAIIHEGATPEEAARFLSVVP